MLLEKIMNLLTKILEFEKMFMKLRLLKGEFTNITEHANKNIELLF